MDGSSTCPCGAEDAIEITDRINDLKRNGGDAVEIIDNFQNNDPVHQEDPNDAMEHVLSSVYLNISLKHNL
jgi:hypothetical protein